MVDVIAMFDVSTEYKTLSIFLNSKTIRTSLMKLFMNL